MVYQFSRLLKTALQRSAKRKLHPRSGEASLHVSDLLYTPPAFPILSRQCHLVRSSSYHGHRIHTTLPPRPNNPTSNPTNTPIQLRCLPPKSPTNPSRTLKSHATNMPRFQIRPLPSRPQLSRQTLRPTRRTQRHRSPNLQTLPTRSLQEGRRVRVRAYLQPAR